MEEITFYKQYDIDINRLKRDYLINPIYISVNGKNSEMPYREDLEYLFLELNISGAKLSEYFGVNRSIFERWTSKLGLKKSKEQIYKSQALTLKKEGLEAKKIKRDKYVSTMLDKYGVDNPMKNSDVLEKARATCKDKFGRDNITQIKLETGVYDILNDCKLLKQYMIENSVINATDLGYKLGIGESTALRYIKKYDLQGMCNYCVSVFEKEIKEYVNQFYNSLNNVKLLDGKEIDIYIPEKNLGIEFNGNWWHNERIIDKKYHQKKSLIAEEQGIFVYHIFEYEWKNKREKIINQLNNLLGINSCKIFGRKCLIKEVSSKEKCDFLNDNHLQGNDKSSVKLGLYYDNNLVSLMTFVKPRFNKKYEWELSRYCCKSGYNVIGGASKLFKHFVSVYNPTNILSYSDIAKTRGGLYKLLGFELDHISAPNYVWYKSGKIKSRYDCQKHKLKAIGLEGDSENEIMMNQGYFRIYDSGNKVWIWRKE